MEFTEFDALLRKTWQQNAIDTPDEETVKRFYNFTSCLLKANETTNLTAIRQIPDVIAKHLADSLFASPQIPSGARVLDLGCGAGFPSFPLAIARPDLSIVALDSTAKKIAFVAQTAKELGLDNLTAISGRAEDAALARKIGKFDVVTGRAVAGMHVLCELCLPYVKLGGAFVALKAAKAQEELDEARHAIQLLGGEIAEVQQRELVLSDGSAEPRSIIVIKKRKETPPQYPRAYAAILKKPL